MEGNEETTWVLLEVKDIGDVGKNEKQRYLLEDVTFEPRGLLFGIATIEMKGIIKVHPATKEKVHGEEGGKQIMDTNKNYFCEYCGMYVLPIQIGEHMCCSLCGSYDDLFEEDIKRYNNEEREK